MNMLPAGPVEEVVVLHVMIVSLALLMPAGPSPAPPDACTLVTKAEVEAVLHEPVQTPERKNMMGTTTCTYATVAATPYKEVQVVVSPWSSPAAWEKTITDQVEQTGLKTRAVANVGDKAYFYIGNLGSDQLYVLKGSSSIHVTLDLGTKDRLDMATSLPLAQALVTKALARMK